MRQVAVTEGDKVAAQAKLGYAVNGYGVGDLVKFVNEVARKGGRPLCDEYEAAYEVAAGI